MKTKIYVLIIGLFALNTAQAKIWRVNNTPTINADYSDFQTALTNTPAGDTLYVEGSLTDYTTSTNIPYRLSKKLTLIGPGYFFQLNDTTQYLKRSAVIIALSVNPGAEGSIIHGMTINSLYLGTNNILISNNNIFSLTPTVWVDENGTSHNINIINANITKNWIGGNYGGFGYGNGMSCTGKVSNNIIQVSQVLLPLGSFTISNNVFLGNSLVTRNSIIQNNIWHASFSGFIGDTYNPLNNTYSNNIYDMSVFQGGTPYQDANYKLKVGSAASGKGTYGVDCGAFGGNDPYVVCGLPASPHIYNVISETSAISSKGLAVKIKVKSQK